MKRLLVLFICSFLWLTTSDVVCCSSEADNPACYFTSDNDGSFTLNCSCQVQTLSSAESLLNRIFNITNVHVCSRISLTIVDSDLIRFDSTVFKPVLNHLSNIPNATIDIGASSFDCVTEPCHLAWLIRDNRHLLQTVHNGRCSNGTRFEDLDTNTICPLTYFMGKSITSNVESEFTCPVENGFFGIPGTCGPEYYQCVDSQAYPQICPSGIVFDHMLIACVDLEVASCRFIVVKDFEDGMISPWFDESQNEAQWMVQDFDSSSSQQPTNNLVFNSTKYLRFKQAAPMGSFGVAEFRSQEFMASPGDVVTFYFWIRSKFVNFNNLELYLVEGGKETRLIGLSQFSTPDNFTWRYQKCKILIPKSSKISLVFYGYSGLNALDAIAIDDIQLIQQLGAGDRSMDFI